MTQPIEQAGRDENAGAAQRPAHPPEDGGRESAPPTLDYASPNRPLRLVTVATFDQSFEAHLALGMLRDRGITCVLADENINAVGQGIYHSMVGGIKLQVPAEDAARAAELLPRRRRKEACPRCGSEDIATPARGAIFTLLAWLLLGIPWLFVRPARQCARCGHLWNPDQDEDEEDEDQGENDDRDEQE